MHILHYCPHAGGVMYEWHYVHFIDELERSGHRVTDCNPIKTLGRIGNKAEYSQILIDAAKRLLDEPGPHMLLAASGTDDNLEPTAIDYISHLGIPCVNLSVDDVVAPHRFHKIGSHFDLHWTTFLGTKAMLEKYGCKVVYLPMAANPYFFKRQKKIVAPYHALAFVGSSYGARRHYVLRLVEEGIPMKVRGKGWESTGNAKACIAANKQPIDAMKAAIKMKEAIKLIGHPVGRKVLRGGLTTRIMSKLRTESLIPMEFAENFDVGEEVSFNKMVLLYSTCTTSLGVLEVGNTFILNSPVIQYRLRDFETTMIGCAHIVRRAPELEQSFLEDKEIIFYDSIDECVEKARYYLAPKNYKLCLKIGDRARKHAEDEHTWICRFDKIWKSL